MIELYLKWLKYVMVQLVSVYFDALLLWHYSFGSQPV
jgi:hypothetical protein